MTTPILEGVRRHYTTVAGRRVHYRQAGSGSPLILLPAVPASSALVLDRIAVHAADRTVIALDLPGLGESEPIAKVSATGIADAIVDVATALGIDRFDLVATGLSATFADAIRDRHTGRVGAITRENPITLDDADRAAWIQSYCLPLTPDSEGGHIARFWTRQRDIHTFFPWFDRRAATRIDADLPPPEQIHAEVVDLFRAGPGYAAVVRAALEPSVSEPVGRAPSPAEPKPVELETMSGDIRREYVDSPVGQLLIRRAGPASGRPLVLFHSSPASGAGLEPMALAFGDRPVVIFDTPGNGDSPPLPGRPEMWDIARVIVAAIDRLGFDDYDVFGTHTGAMLAIEVGIADPRVRHVVADGVTMFNEAVLRDFLPRYLVPMAIVSQGSHLFQAWQNIRDTRIWYPWYDHSAGARWKGTTDLSAGSLHRHFVEFLKGATTYQSAYRAAIAYPTADRLPRLAVPLLLCVSPTDPLVPDVQRAAPFISNGRMQSIPGTATADDLAATYAIYRAFYDA